MFDPRIDQANERTLLAWVRTGLGLMAFGFVVARSGDWVRMITDAEPAELGAFGWIGVGLVALGSVFPALAVGQFVRIQRAITAGTPIPTGRVLGPTLAILLAVLGLVMIALLIAA
jgi:putative membrane protein